MSVFAIQLDIAYNYHHAAVLAVQRCLAQTHGSQFADAFVKEHNAAILQIVRTRLCGRTEHALGIDITLLRAAYHNT